MPQLGIEIRKRKLPLTETERLAYTCIENGCANVDRIFVPDRGAV